MNSSLFIVVGTLAFVFLSALVISGKSMVSRVMASILAIGIAAFCTFGFLASFEPSDSPSWPWQIGYGIIGAASLMITASLLRSVVRMRSGGPAIR